MIEKAEQSGVWQYQMKQQKEFWTISDSENEIYKQSYTRHSSLATTNQWIIVIQNIVMEDKPEQIFRPKQQGRDNRRNDMNIPDH